MFENLPASRMNDRENSATERLIAGAREPGGKHTLHDASRHFPSYLRLFGTFFEMLIFKSLWGAARSRPRCYGRFSTAEVHVAFL
jgi:hypothetical protein